MIKRGRRPKEKRNNKIMDYVDKGFTLTRIAGIFHISKGRVSQIVSAQLELRNNGKDRLEIDSGESDKGE